MPAITELSYSECEALLRAGVAGRVSVNGPEGPHIVPVNYSVVDAAVVMYTTPTSVLGCHGLGSLVAFEVDQFDYVYQRGWSVVARGRVHAVEGELDRERIRRVWPPRPWVADDRWLVLRLPWTSLSGRRVGHGYDPFRDLPVRRAT